MNAISSPSLPSPGLSLDLQNQDPKKLGKSCREFEANLWRQILERALSPLLASPESSGGASNGVYSYFLTNTIAERVSGQPNGFSSLLQAKMAAQAPHTTSTSDPICTQAATH